MIAYYLCGMYKEALFCSEEMLKNNTGESVGYLMCFDQVHCPIASLSWQYFWDSLILLELYPSSSREVQAKYRRRIITNQQQLKELVANPAGPQNWQVVH